MMNGIMNDCVLVAKNHRVKFNGVLVFHVNKTHFFLCCCCFNFCDGLLCAGASGGGVGAAAATAVVGTADARGETRR